MSPNYGSNTRPPDLVPDWLLGGNRKRRILEALAAPGPAGAWTAKELTAQLGCGSTTVYEVLRSLRPLGVLEADAEGRVRLAREQELAQALRALLVALAPLAHKPVERPPRRRAGA
jgi:DNA-binding IclR family transcriptional regulator